MTAAASPTLPLQLGGALAGRVGPVVGAVAGGKLSIEQARALAGAQVSILLRDGRHYAGRAGELRRQQQGGDPGYLVVDGTELWLPSILTVVVTGWGSHA